MENMKPYDLLNNMKHENRCTPQVQSMGTSALAYMGDVLFEMHIRDHLLRQSEAKVHRLHQKTISYVNASAQAWMVQKLMPCLTQEEVATVRRGRNGKSGTVPRNADVQEYRYATGFEALLGWLYFCEDYARLVEVMGIAVTLLESSRDEVGSDHEAI